MKLLICGHGGHGKDTVADIIAAQTGFVSTSSSNFAMQVLEEQIKQDLGYASFKEAHLNRSKHRPYLYELIRDYNSPNKSRLSREILVNHQIYVGMRDLEEFHASKHLYDLMIWVDASERLPLESKESFNIPKDEFDFIIENNTTLPDLIRKVERIADKFVSEL